MLAWISRKHKLSESRVWLQTLAQYGGCEAEHSEGAKLLSSAPGLFEKLHEPTLSVEDPGMFMSTRCACLERKRESHTFIFINEVIAKLTYKGYYLLKSHWYEALRRNITLMKNIRDQFSLEITKLYRKSGTEK